MQNDNIQVAVRGFQQKLDAFNVKIQYQQLLAQSLTAEFESLTSEFESLKRLFDASSEKVDTTSNNIESTLEKIDASSYGNESTSPDYESTLEKVDTSSSKTESTSNDSALSSIRELASLILRSAKELKIYFGQPSIPNRMAKILLALGEKKKLSVAEMRQITGVSRNSLVRDIKVFKLLGWLEFHGSRKNGYFTLTDSVPDVIFRKGSG